MRFRFFVSALVLVASPAVTHDFWLQPAQFQVASNAPLGATFQVGHGTFRERWNNNDRVIMLGDFFGGRRSDRLGDLKSGGDADVITRFAEPGLHILGMQSSYAFSELPAIRFNDYAQTEGLVLITAARQRAGGMGKAGRERYSRRAKALIQVGAQTAANSAMATRPIGLKLEIVPDRNPYALDASRTLPVHILYNGKRLANATVKLTNLANDEKPVGVVRTDREGRARFRVPAGNIWQLNVVWSEPVQGDAKAEFDTTFSSLTFGYPSTRRTR